MLAKALRFPLSANRASKEVGIDFANTVELWFYFRVLEAGAPEGMPPMIRGEKTGIRSKLRIDIDVGKTIQDLKYQFRIHRLVEIGAHALTDYQAATRRERVTSLTQAEQEILGHMQHVDAINEVELAASNPLSFPW